MAKDPSSGQAAGRRPPKAGRKGVTIDLKAEDVGKGSAKGDAAAATAQEPVRSAASRKGRSGPEPSMATSEPVKAGPLKADVARDKAAKESAANGKAAAGKAVAAEEPAKSGAADAGKTAAGKAKAAEEPSKSAAAGAGKPSASKPEAVRPSPQPSASPSAISRLLAAIVGGVIALGGAVALDRLQILSVFGDEPGLSDVQAEITAMRQESDGRIADLRAQIAALAGAGGADAGEVAALAAKLAEMGALLAEQETRLARAEQPRQPGDLEKRLAALESAVQSGAAGPQAGLAALEQKLAGVEEAVAAVQGLASEAAKDTLAAVKPEIDRLNAAAGDLAGRIETLAGGLGGLADAQSVAALEARVEGLAAVVQKTVSPQAVAALKSALAAESLTAAVASGRPFVAELQILQESADGGPDLTAIAPYAEQGLPETSALAAEFEALVPSLLPPEQAQPAAPESGGLVDRLMASARNVVEIRRAGREEDSELTRQSGAILEALAGNDLKAALTAWRKLPPQAQQASAGWAAKLEARLAAEALAGSLRSKALLRLVEGGGGEGQ